MVIERSLESHAQDAILLCHKAQLFSQPQLKAVCIFQGYTEEIFEFPRIDLCTVGIPEKIIYHPLPFCEAQGQRSRKRIVTVSLLRLYY